MMAQMLSKRVSSFAAEVGFMLLTPVILNGRAQITEVLVDHGVVSRHPESRIAHQQVLKQINIKNNGNEVFIFDITCSKSRPLELSLGTT